MTTKRYINFLSFKYSESPPLPFTELFLGGDFLF